MKFLSIAAAFVLVLAMLSGCAENAADNPKAENAGYIGIDSAKQIVFDYAGVAENSVKGLEAELDTERSFAVYEICFDTDNYEYEYEVNALTGEIVRVYREIDDSLRLPEATDSDRTPHGGTSDTPALTEPVPPATSAPDTTSAPETTVPSDPEFIGRDRAKEIALEHAGVKESEAYDLEVELDRERGVTVYDVSFDADGFDYDYEIDAQNGDILRSDKERDGDYRPADVQKPTTQAASQGEDIGSAEAERIALEHAGYTADEVYALKTEPDRENGVDIYDVSFEVEGYDYDYDIDRKTGEILKSSKEPDRDAPKTKRTEDSTEYITEDKAKEIALNHAGLSESDVRKLEIELDSENGVMVYDVSFDSAGYEYDYEINASTGAIIKSDKERD